jgi:hypothetical protein
VSKYSSIVFGVFQGLLMVLHFAAERREDICRKVREGFR